MGENGMKIKGEEEGENGVKCGKEEGGDTSGGMMTVLRTYILP